MVGATGLARKTGELSSSLADDLEHGFDGLLEVDTDVGELLATNVSTMINETMDVVAMVLMKVVAASTESCNSFSTLYRINIVEGTLKSESNRSILVIMSNVCLSIKGYMGSKRARVGRIGYVGFNEKVSNVG